MTPQDLEPIVTVALMAAQADGTTAPEELARLKAAVTRLGIPDPEALVQRLASDKHAIGDITGRLTSDEARRLAYQTALVVVMADGFANPAEQKFLASLRTALGLTPVAIGQIEESAASIATAPITTAVVPAGGGAAAGDAGLDELVLQQAMLTGALELLPEGLANVAILPLQLRMVYQIGQHYGQKLDINQVKDLAGTLGIGAAAQVMEGVVRKMVGGFLLGGLIGGAAGVAAGAAVTFSGTYALGHVAKQYYAQGRKLSTDDLRNLFARFRSDAETIWPKIQNQVQQQARNLNLPSVMGMLKQ
ncbi:MAG TPA: DUF533 domain-containing protein [Gemmatimonadales bacterium]|jgi:uncharacterized protein (DUF697 family)/tellurite resistance protein|nr:DUF533 domain-containing protein [Gemmatimonadales bacterium]